MLKVDKTNIIQNNKNINNKSNSLNLFIFKNL